MGLLYALGALGAALLGYAFVGRRPAAQPSDDAQDPARLPQPAGPSGDPLPDREPPADHVSEARGTGEIVAPPKLQEWAAMLAPGCVASGIQLPYGLKWIDLESGGNPCEVGYPPAHGERTGPWADLPREMGIAQFYNPDDLRALGLNGTELRAYCMPGDQHEILYRGKIIRGFSSAMIRPILPQEMRRQADGAIGLIRRCMSAATRDLSAIGAGPSWSNTRRSYWALVKLQHGLPVLSREGLPAVTRLLGRPPADWAQFAGAMGRVRLRPDIEQQYRGDFARILANAATCASAFTERWVG